MELTRAEMSYIRSQGLHLTEKCDHCGEVLNQTFDYRLNDRDPGSGVRRPARTRTWAGKGGGTRPGSTTSCTARGTPAGEALSRAGPTPCTAPRGAGSGPVDPAKAGPPDGHRSRLWDPRFYWGFCSCLGRPRIVPCRKPRDDCRAVLAAQATKCHRSTTSL